MRLRRRALVPGWLALVVALAGCDGASRGGGREAARGAGAAAASPVAPRGEPSELWGENGEEWSPTGRLPDFSWAGYGGGGVPLPEPPVVADVTEFGARPDDGGDDTDAFLAALAAVPERGGGALFVPAGRWEIRRPLDIRVSNLVLRGAGRDATILHFPLPLYEVLGKGPWGGKYGWAWGGGWIWAQGEFEELPPLARVTERARRGDTSLRVSSTAGLSAGQMVRLIQEETDGSLSLHIHAGFVLDGGCNVDRPGHRSMDWAVRIARVEGDRLHFDRPLRIDVRPEWGARLLPFRPTVAEVGVEHLTVEFPATVYNGHHKEIGYNAIALRDVAQSWVRDVRVVNFDNAILFWYARYSTARDLLLEGRGGHYGLSLGGSQDSLMTEFTIRNVSLHDLSFANLANGSVFSRGRGVQIAFDHHRGASYENLFSAIDVGESWRWSRIWACSYTPSGHYTAARQTFWNIRPRIKTAMLPAWPQMNVIGPLRGAGRVDESLPDPWVEDLEHPHPADLHAAQLARRLGGADAD